MKLRSLTLSNVRKFGGQSATIDGIGDGVTVISQANEFGKSTFFDALHALFFVKYGAGGKDVKSLQPRSGGAVRVQAEVETDAGRFLVEKSFLAQKRAAVTDVASGKLIAQDDEAEQWIADLVDSGLEGPAGLLWVRQGTTALEPAGNVGADKAEKERLLGVRRDLLSSVAGEIDMVTGGRRMDRVLAQCQAALGKLATARGSAKAHGPWDVALKDIVALQGRQAELSLKCNELSDALARRKEVEVELDRVQLPDDVAARQAALARAQQAHAQALAHVEQRDRAQGVFDLKTLEQDKAAQGLDRLVAAKSGLDGAVQAEAAARDLVMEAETGLDRLARKEQEARAAVDAAGADLEGLRRAQEAARQAETARKAGEQAEDLGKQLASAEAQRKSYEAAQAVLAGAAVTAQMVDKIAHLQSVVGQNQAAAAARQVSISVAYDGAARIAVAGSELADGAVVSIVRRTELMLPGIGRMVVDPGSRAEDEDVQTVLRQAKGDLAAALQACGVETIEAARAALSHRTEAAEQAKFAQKIIATLAPDGLKVLRARFAQAQALAAGADLAAEPVDLVALAGAVQAAEQAERTAGLALEAAKEKQGQARVAMAGFKAELSAAETELAAAKAAFGDPDTFEQRKNDAARGLAVSQTAAQDARVALEKIIADAPDMATTGADLKRAETVVEQAEKRIALLGAELVRLNAAIQARAEDGVEQALAEVEGQLDAAQARAARYGAEVAALQLLSFVLEDRRTQARDAYFGPVQEELKPLLSILHQDAALSFNPERMLPDGLERSGEQEGLEELSGGTQEQIAILTRLAFAKLFAKQGRPMPIILDDALVYSDDDRIVKMFTALHRVAVDLQVIVFSCRQRAFSELGGDQPEVRISQL